MPSANPKPAIEVIDLVKDFAGRRAVDNISFDVPRGQICALLGPNGAGKTTTIQVLLGLTLPTSGRALVLGHDIVEDRTAAVVQTNFMASYVAFPWRLKVYELLRVYAELYSVPNPKAAIEEVVEVFALQDLMKRQSQTMSSGQQTIVGLAKALMTDPALLFLDEPTASLDPEHAFEVRQALTGVAREKGMTIFITSHNMPEIERMADRILFLSKGSIVADATADELRERFKAADLEEVFLQVAREGREA